MQIVPSLLVVPDVSANVTLGVGSEFTVIEAETDAAQLVVELVTVTI